MMTEKNRGLRETAQRICEAIGTVLVGKEYQARLAVMTLLAGGHLLLEDVPGVGKTTLANALAKAAGCDFARIQFTPDTLPGDVTGVSVYRMNTGTFEYVPGAVMHSVILADEINRTAPKTQASLLEAMEEHQVTVDGEMHPLPEPFMVIATQNPVDFLGTYHLPEAQLDRFLMRISLGYPEEADELRMVERFLGHSTAGNARRIDAVPAAADRETVLAMQKAVSEVFVQPEVRKYAVMICRAARELRELELGPSPRAVLALVRAAQAAAFLDGRDYVLPDDVKQLVLPVLAHRLVLTVEARADRKKPEELLNFMMSHIAVPY